MNAEITECAAIFKALSDETRLKIVSVLSVCTTCACKLLAEFNFTQPTLSYHIKQLTDCGLVCAKRVGRWVHYSVNPDKLRLISDFLARVEKQPCQTGNAVAAECAIGEDAANGSM